MTVISDDSLITNLRFIYTDTIEDLYTKLRWHYIVSVCYDMKKKIKL